MDELEELERGEGGLVIAAWGAAAMIVVWIGLIVWATLQVDPLSIIALWVPLGAGAIVGVTLVALPKKRRLRSGLASSIATGITGSVALILLALLVLLLVASV
jgi:hypothetical protein